MPQLDVLRALAALVVIYFHLGPQKFSGSYKEIWGIPVTLGAWGVNLFFVLSGFLITGILLKCRESSHSPYYELKQFYIRRSLRIFPLYYLVMFTMVVLHHTILRQTLPWHLTYTSNFYFAIHQKWSGEISHLWSLSVEEQFYLIWPLLMLFLPTRVLLPFIVATIFVAPMYIVVGGLFGLNTIALQVLMPGTLDTLGIGALLGYWRYHNYAEFASWTQRPMYRWIGFPLLLAQMAAWWVPHPPLQLALSNFCSALLFAWLVHQAAVGIGGPIGRVLEFKPLIYLGRISYGLYLWHNFSPSITSTAFRILHFTYPEPSNTRFVLLLGVTIAIASFTWFFFERPINNLKQKFSYR